jgi:hypothetical protein
MATRAASIGGIGRTKDRETADEQNCHDKVLQDFVSSMVGRPRPAAP